MPLPERPESGAFLAAVSRDLRRDAESLVPWFLHNMPDYYFRTHGPDEQARHIRTVISGRVLSGGQSATLWNPARTRVTRIAPNGAPSLLEHLRELTTANIRTSRLYATLDGRLRLDTFLLEPQPPVGAGSRALREAVALMLAGGHLPPGREKEFIAFLRGAPADYVEKFDPLRAARHFALARDLAGRDAVRVELHLLPGQAESRVVVAMREAPETGLLLRVAQTVLAEGLLAIPRGYSDRFSLPGGDLSVISLYVTREGGVLTPDDPLWARLKRRLKRVKWTAAHGLDVLVAREGFAPEAVELLSAACECVHQLLVRQNLHAFTSENIVRAVLAHVRQVRACLAFFEARFDPALFAGRKEAAARALAEAGSLASGLEDEVARGVFGGVLAFFGQTLRTNYYLPDRFGLAFRLDPAVLTAVPAGVPAPAGERPFGLFFLHGPGGQGFHVRYREMARGGVRLVRTRSQEQFELESNRLFTEAKNLALSQQYKNKDIPEGGAKAVLLLGPGADPTLALKSAVDGLLDCTLSGPDGAMPAEVVDYLGREELLYLGPDEGITPDHIRWIVARAARRGAKWPAAFMSSKPESGINHKRYGVTSLGVLEFADAFLREAGIDPDAEPFTVKITGGPAGDVAGNAILQLIARYGGRARIVAVSDGHGAAFDPRGLDHRELTRLVREERNMAAFSPERLVGPGSFAVRADTPDGAKVRASLHNTVPADLFIPAGGRPDTLNAGNWRDFCDADGRPSARVIIEGANLFLTSEARLHLEAAGALIAPGPSANKAGVICSSYEILAGLVMTEAEFAAVRRRYIREVLAILGRKARAEAALLLRERRRSGGRVGLVALSREASQEITAVKDAIIAALADAPPVADDPLLARLVADHCPPVLVTKYFDRLLATVPASYLQAVVAAQAASTIVYAEGLGWLSRLSGLRDLLAVVQTYYAEADAVAAHVAAIRKSRLPGRAAIERICLRAGRRLLSEEALGLDVPGPSREDESIVVEGNDRDKGKKDK
ncbi:Glu/Leu/Phe/Val dehydrogenase [Solidesulfovibrio carbinoliphilus subsp. oakridgensis]|uniref:Glu/Leu/Phe/Val dehydrogenase n=1 Tax=Solidesulfovibrio carbinoliphilus subsp. oakridgensis TaxID=694327 RepID=G7QDH6_9BACT|nr:NAD-glutamate dehydrogenase domain-containing protein [Solidesulfovibrio carbinoliphilus]EHJ46482.1 Glu/Leu/Phe/Val dehydrogenase [Solidesulfovibrio carbinoliphilus subsp. oakridgensis]